MPNPKITISQIGEDALVREMTNEEVELHAIAQKEMTATRLDLEKQVQDQINFRQAILTKLGLTEDEAKALLGQVV